MKRLSLLLLIGSLITGLSYFLFSEPSGANNHRSMDWVTDYEVRPGTEGMVEILDEINRFYDASRANRKSEDWLRKLKNRIYKTEGTKVYEAKFMLNNGQTKEVIEVLEGIATPLKSSDPLFTNANETLAIAYLRKGEEDNCIQNHTDDSCILPIKKTAVYTLQADTRKAIDIYLKLLEKHPDDWRYRWLLNVAYQTIGEYPDKVPEQWLIYTELMLDQDPTDNFTNIASRLKVDDITPAGGAVMDDFNNDGLLDIFTSGMTKSPLRYYVNQGERGFIDQTAKANLDGLTGGFNLYQLDYNNDGWLDLLIVRGAWKHTLGRYPNSLLQNNQDGTFTDVTVKAGLLAFHPVATAVCADFNNDGWTDIYIGNESHPRSKLAHPNDLYLNNGNGGFQNVSLQSGTATVGITKGLSAGDYNNDGLTDIFVSIRNGKNFLLKNIGVSPEGIPQFQDVSPEAGIEEPLKSLTSWFWDYNNDGLPDIFVCSYEHGEGLSAAAAAKHFAGVEDTSGRVFIYQNDGDATFSNQASQLGLNFSLFTMGANFGDVNNDGWLDFYLGTGEPDYMGIHPNRMLISQGGTKFIDQSSELGVGHIQKGHGIAFGDIDQDGDQDILAEMGGIAFGDEFQNALFQNPGNTNHWIVLKLEGTSSSKDAIGAKLKLVLNDGDDSRTIYRVVSSGGSFGSNSLQQEIGLHRYTQIDRLEITWPNSPAPQVFRDIRADAKYLVVEGDPTIHPAEYIPLKFNETQASPHQHH